MTAAMPRLLLFVVVSAIALAGCGEKSSWLSGCGEFEAKNSQETEAFEDSLSSWLKTNGFRPANDPGGITSVAGMHTTGEITKWYQGSYQDSPLFLLRMQTVPRTDVGGGYTSFRFDCAWEVNGSEEHIAEMKTVSAKFTEAFIGWLEQQKVFPNETDAGGG